MKLKVWAFGLALGIVWGLSLFILTLIAINTGYSYADIFLGVIDSIYPWYSWSVAGAFVGLGLGFIDGFLGGAIIAWIYNRFVK